MKRTTRLKTQYDTAMESAMNTMQKNTCKRTEKQYSAHINTYFSAFCAPCVYNNNRVLKPTTEYTEQYERKR